MKRLLRGTLAVVASLALTAGFLVVGAPSSHAFAGITVDTTVDEPLSDPNNGACAIREAIEAANTDTEIDTCTSGADSIQLGTSAGTYDLSVANDSQLAVTEALTIVGHSSTIHQLSSSDRVLSLNAGSYTVNLQNLTLTGANSPCDCDGAVMNVGTGVTVNTDTVVFNQGQAGSGNGGAIYNSGTTNLFESTVGNLNVANNLTSPTGGGGGIYNNGGTVKVDRSLVWMNQAFGNGGGIFNLNGTLTVINSTINGNVSGENGGGIFNGTTGSAVTNVFGSTIAENRADYLGSSTPLGGGGGVAQGGGTLTLYGSIVANNIDETGSPGSDPNEAPDCTGTIASQDYNLIGKTDNCTYSSQSGDLTGTIASPKDPGIGGLTNSGGPTQSQVPSATSPVLDENVACAGPSASVLTEDQRGLDRPQETVCDIGAAERDQDPPTTPTLNKPDKRFLKENPIVLEWTASTDTADLAPVAYDPSRMNAPYNGDFQNALIFGGMFTTTVNVNGKKGVTSCFKIHARDQDGNVSPDSNERCIAMPVDDRKLKRKGNWKEGTGPDYYLQTFLKTKQEDASLKLKNIVDVKRMILVATKCPGCGKVEVSLGGNVLKTVSLNAATEKRNSQIKLKTFNAPADGTAKIKVVSDNKLVKIEGLGISKV